MNSTSRTRRLTAIALLTVTGVALRVAESYIPFPLPYLTIGLANISSVIALFMLGMGEMFAIVILCTVVGSLFVGSFMISTLLLQLAAGLASAGIMALAKTLRKNLFSPVGISLLGSFAYSIIGIVIVQFMFLRNISLLFMMPQQLLFALIGGIAIGLLSLRFLVVYKEPHS